MCLDLNQLQHFQLWSRIENRICKAALQWSLVLPWLTARKFPGEEQRVGSGLAAVLFADV
jgi:hypothetical protein